MSLKKHTKHLLYFFLLGAIIILALWMIPKRVGVGLYMDATEYSNLPGWQDDNHLDALSAFQKSCESLVRLPKNRPLRPKKTGGTAGDWHQVCKDALKLGSILTDNNSDRGVAQAFFEAHFTPLTLSAEAGDDGFLTGYYEPLMEGNHTQTTTYNVPLYKRPSDLVTVDLGSFRDDLKGRRIAGRVKNGALKPFETHEQIDSGALENQGLELIWLKSHVDAFFLHIQGSGRVRLPDGSFQKVGYDGPNGHPYTAIGGVLVKWGELKRVDVTMPAIKKWITENPDRAPELMQANKSYIFFRALEGSGPLGSQGVVLTPGRSLAVDRNHIPLSAPVFLAGSHPDPNNLKGPSLPLNRLVIAQDTGGAIRGELRGDVFWGMGVEPEIIAGNMKNEAKFFMLLPKALAKRVVDAQPKAGFDLMGFFR
jgi:membrane-bound lytic murein transglycosylase A